MPHSDTSKILNQMFEIRKSNQVHAGRLSYNVLRYVLWAWPYSGGCPIMHCVMSYRAMFGSVMGRLKTTVGVVILYFQAVNWSRFGDGIQEIKREAYSIGILC